MMTWKSPGTNSEGEYCLYPEGPHYHSQKADLEVELKSNSGVIFHIRQINNANKKCLNPYFPVILIKPNIQHDGWIHVVYTDSIDPKFRRFVDYDPRFTNAPFYIHSQYFYDAPLWTYPLFKNSMFWKGHAFAIKLDHANKTISCIGGIEWGFELSPIN
jgi:hypothetical protein